MESTILSVIVRGHCIIISSQGFECILLYIYLLTGTYTQSPEQRYRRTPTLHSMLEQEGCDDAG
ncbi:MAG: hypothetical protein Q8J68_02395 [Methanolobus sp.]|uniref:hypothetical protein n=1 Tax=Methanolobus sp. TaxID=1874737 RepID=UPI00273181C1|nr:hypothetical protein [Methanolobus sp.]MDP2216124.1 hypothetical protein [Methanolobus sp.]